jgi:predicted RNA-binding protein with PUA-like domain
VDVIPVKPIAAFTLEQIKNHIDLQDIMLLKQSRLSVMPLSKKAFEILSGEA